MSCWSNRRHLRLRIALTFCGPECLNLDKLIEYHCPIQEFSNRNNLIRQRVESNRRSRHALAAASMSRFRVGFVPIVLAHINRTSWVRLPPLVGK